jgi:hypothetical protein
MDLSWGHVADPCQRLKSIEFANRDANINLSGETRFAHANPTAYSDSIT